MAIAKKEKIKTRGKNFVFIILVFGLIKAQMWLFSIKMLLTNNRT